MPCLQSLLRCLKATEFAHQAHSKTQTKDACLAWKHLPVLPHFWRHGLCKDCLPLSGLSHRAVEALQACSTAPFVGFAHNLATSKGSGDEESVKALLDGLGLGSLGILVVS